MRAMVMGLLVLVGFVGPAAAQPLEAGSDEGGHADARGWSAYGGQILAVDAAALTLTTVGLTNGSAAVAALGAGAWLLGGPIVHGFHEQAARGGGSFALRLLAPPVTGLLAALAASDCRGEWCAVGWFALGGLGGVVGASVIDAAALAWERDEVSRPIASLTPAVVVSPERTTFGVRGAF